jgi:hypothetical protein
MIGMNSITTKNNTIITLHLNNEERGSERLAPYSELYGNDASSLHRVAPMPFNVKLVFTSSSSSLLIFLNTEYNIRLTIALPLTSILEISLPLM